MVDISGDTMADNGDSARQWLGRTTRFVAINNYLPWGESNNNHSMDGQPSKHQGVTQLEELLKIPKGWNSLPNMLRVVWALVIFGHEALPMLVLYNSDDGGCWLH